MGNSITIHNITYLSLRLLELRILIKKVENNREGIVIKTDDIYYSEMLFLLKDIEKMVKVKGL